MIKISIHLVSGSVLSFDCPDSGALYDQVAGIVSNMGDTQSGEARFVGLPLSDSSNITVALEDVLAVESHPRHAFPASSKLLFSNEPIDEPDPGQILDESPPGPKVKLTIGMATYDDYDGVYFTIQALRLYHPEVMSDVEFIVVDNNPTGVCANSLKALETQIPNYRYVPHGEKSGTTVRGQIFEQSNGTYILGLDCHVFLVPGALKKLMDYFDAHPETRDLLQGPLLYDNLTTLATHFHPEWRGGMYGYWELNEAGKEIDSEPFDIPMQGMGLFACKRTAWPGFSDKLSGFGGEEGYIHEKFRQAGGRTLCLPFLRWVHRFERPRGVPYRNTWEDRIRNYVIGFTELGLDIEPIREHFGTLVGQSIANNTVASAVADLEDAS